MSSITLLIYHYLTTFDAEFTHFWGKHRKFGLGWALFLANRYLPFVTYTLEATWWSFSRSGPTRCTLAISQLILQSSQYTLWGAISCLRVHALRQNWPLALLVLLLSYFSIACNFVVATYLHPDISPAAGCFPDQRRLSFGLYQTLYVLSYTAYVLSEALVVGVTLYATSHRKDLNSALGGGKMSLSAVLFRDGLIYFVAIILLHIGPFVLGTLDIVRPGSKAPDYVNSLFDFSDPLTSILLTQFYFDLQETADLPIRVDDAPGWTCQFSTGTQADLQFVTHGSGGLVDSPDSSTSFGTRRLSAITVERAPTSD